MFDKVKVILIGLVPVLVASAAAYFADVDFAQFGVFGPPVGVALAALFAYFKKETTGYGAGVQKPSDQIPGGSPLPTGAHEV